LKEKTSNELTNDFEEDDKILVVTHSAFIRMSTTEMAYKLDRIECYPEDCYRPANCEIISLNIA
jgi:broad specificity phosphatase PhoE